MPAAASADPEQVERPARAGHRHAQRPDELERDRDPQRDPVDRGVEAGVHARQDEPEGRGQPQLAPVPRPRTSGRQIEPEHHGGEQHAQEHGAARPEVVEQRGGQPGAELHRAGGQQHEDGGRHAAIMPFDGCHRDQAVAGRRVRALRAGPCRRRGPVRVRGPRRDVGQRGRHPAPGRPAEDRPGGQQVACAAGRCSSRSWRATSASRA